MRLILTVREGDRITGTSGRRLNASLVDALNDHDMAQGRPGESDAIGLPARPDVATLAPGRWRHVHDHVFADGVELDAAPDVTIAALQDRALRMARERGLALVPGGQFTEDTIERIWLADLFTGHALNPEETVRAAGLAAGDVVILRIQYKLRSMYSLGPVPRPQDMLAILQAAAAWSDKPPGLWGALLYTDADAGLARYVREYFDELNALSGSDLRLFVVERPASWRTAKRYWRDTLTPELYRTFAALRWLRWQPYERHRVYDLACELGVAVTQLPCLVLFHNVHDPHKAVFPLASTSPAYLRHLFSRVHAAVRPGTPGFRETAAEDVTGKRVTSLYGAKAALAAAINRAQQWPEGTPEHAAALAQARLLLAGPLSGPNPEWTPSDARAIAKGRTLLAGLSGRDDQPHSPFDPFDQLREMPVGTPEGAAALDRVLAAAPDINRELGEIATAAAEETRPMTQNNFHFHGQTTFINQPVDTVIRDFQNDHGTGPGAAELVQMLRLLLTSQDLADADRQEAAGLVHTVADDLAASDPDGQAPTRLERLSALVADAADIAQPAAELIAAVSDLMPL